MTNTNRPTIPPENGDEISLREIYEIIRQKQLAIIVITVLFAAIAGAYSFIRPEKQLAIIVITVLFAAIAGAYSFIRPENYAYQACVSMGVIGRDANGQPIFVDSPQGVEAQLNNAYIPFAIDSLVNKKKEN
ncbi:Wzz/FepE/Etk N-terminal domain-containing protein (plasmid) [Acidithiobacillus ferruginosus]|uniref:Wzz/FepE/Etk N-terminal domain-containing protein n=1 Tax=Acidithiobacillus ferruginosus TaxID=3063951 RepID=A0ACD5IMI4_9PROT